MAYPAARPPSAGVLVRLYSKKQFSMRYAFRNDALPGEIIAAACGRHGQSRFSLLAKSGICAISMVVRGILLLAFGLSLPQSALGHGGLSMDDDMCRLRVGPYNIHFVGYQPESSAEKEFCEDIPQTGQTVVVLDYIDQELRTMPVEVRIIRATESEADLDAVTVLYLPPKIYPTGSLHFQHAFAEPGKFVGLVTVNDTQKLVARFPFSVGNRGGNGRHVGWILLAIAIGAGLYFYSVKIRPRIGA